MATGRHELPERLDLFEQLAEEWALWAAELDAQAALALARGELPLEHPPVAPAA